MIRAFFSTLFGIAIGISGVLLHNAYRPFGLAASLIALILGGYLVRESRRSRLHSWLYLAGWLLMVVRGSTVGNGGELLIEANSYGNLFVFGGFALILIFTIRSKKAT